MLCIRRSLLAALVWLITSARTGSSPSSANVAGQIEGQAHALSREMKRLKRPGRRIKAVQAMQPVRPRKLQSVSSSICEWSNNKCSMQARVGEAYVQSLPTASPVRTLLADYTTCHALEEETCKASAVCEWTWLGCSIFMSQYPLSALDTASCGMWDAYMEVISHEATCSLSSTCTAKTCKEEVVPAEDGTCEEEACTHVDADPFDQCGSSFTKETSMANCVSAIGAEAWEAMTAAAQSAQYGECFAQDCPEFADFWRALFALEAECASQTTEITCDTTRCTWNDGDVRCESSGALSFLTAILDSVDTTCKAKGQIEEMQKCEGAVTAAGCPANHGCHLVDRMSCDDGLGNNATRSNPSCDMDFFHMLSSTYGHDPEACAFALVGQSAEDCHAATTEVECAAVTAPDFICSVGAGSGAVLDGGKPLAAWSGVVAVLVGSALAAGF